MNISVSRQELLALLTPMYTVVPQKPIIPSFLNFHLAFTDGTLVATCCDGEVMVKGYMEGATHTVPVDFQAPAKMFMAAIRNIEDDIIKIQVLKTCVNITAKKSKFKVPAEPGEMPELFIDERVSQTDYKMSEFLRAHYASKFCKPKDPRPPFTGVCVHSGVDGQIFYGTDGYCAYRYLNPSSFEKEQIVFIPKKMFDSVYSMIQKDDDSPIYMGFGFKNSSASYKNYEITCSNINVETVPRYESFFRPANERRQVSHNQLSEMISKASEFCDDMQSVVFSLEHDRMRIKTYNSIDNQEADIEEEIDPSEDISSGLFSHNLLSKVVNACVSEYVDICDGEDKESNLMFFLDRKSGISTFIIKQVIQ